MKELVERSDGALGVRKMVRNFLDLEARAPQTKSDFVESGSYPACPAPDQACQSQGLGPSPHSSFHSHLCATGVHGWFVEQKKSFCSNLAG